MQMALLVVALFAGQVAASAAPTGEGSANERCAVWDRETSFAESVKVHDAAAFAAHLHPDAVFIGGNDKGTQGAAAVAEEWAGLIAGEGILLRWYPDAVDVGAHGTLAISRGPYWMENPAAPEGKRFLKGRFVSTWQRGDDGQWLVVFDGGGGNVPVPATADEIAALAAAQNPCPVP